MEKHNNKEKMEFIDKKIYIVYKRYTYFGVDTYSLP